VHVETFPAGPLGCNCSIIADVDSRRAVVVDPGGDYARIRARLDALDLQVDAIIHTHTHVDHVGCTAELQRASGAPASIHHADRFLYRLLPVQAALVGTSIPQSAEMDDSLVDGRAVRAGDVELGVLHTPGHTPGSCSFVLSTGGRTYVFAGDTLFQGSIGRTDLWGGDHVALLRSIHSKLLTLPDDAVVITGHGPSTTIAEERARNPFLQGR
jgi:glyoxylase-like metal-dependent hydrolase (beta-lactamase superfamily II)